ncbi:U-box domain-containing protein 40-like [Andrographis paniculata]|uniref:U-box domain-containing protein 40-like n=1 Tax=Andrographis paniculata TaxID=175694 RepID=UPI0021E92DB0|nr:U-box domain-containing protein 40-like [Andrographis paniculata]
MGSGKQRWKIASFHKSPSSLFAGKKLQNHHRQAPIEFLCPLSGSIMADPVIVASGHTFERNCVLACLSLSFNPTLADGAFPDFSALIPNLALRSTIRNWCRHHLLEPPETVDFYSAQEIVRRFMPQLAAAVVNRTPSEVSVASSDGTLTPRIRTATPPPFSARASCCSSSSSSEIETNFSEENEIIAKFRSSEISEQEAAVVSLRQQTRTEEESRVRLCTPRLLSALRSLLAARYSSSLQANAAATVVNLSLEKENKVKIVRSGIVPTLIDALRGGSPESQDHAAGALFSLSLDDQNKTAIGVLGALPPLLSSLRSDSVGTRRDSALALYHLSLVQSNRVKLIKLGSIQILLGMVKSGWMPGRILLILCNMAGSVEGRAAMLDGGAVECLVNYLNHGEAATRESCLAAIYGLSYGGLRFKGLAKEAAAEAALRRAEAAASERGKEKVKRILEVLRDKEDEEEEIDWEELLNSDDSLSRTQ